MRARAGRLLANGAVRFAVVFLTLSAVAAPSLGFWFSLEPDREVAAQVGHARVSPPDRYVDSLRSLRFENSVPILTYHGIDENDTRYSVTPDAFNMQMAALAAAGFHTITSRQFVGFLRGTATLPEKPILLTFDDSVKSVWINADAILELYGFHGVVFTITGRVGAHQPYYMTWKEVERMAESGRWDFESHTKFGHSRVRVGAGVDVAAFLTNREWLLNVGRLETLPEYSRRVEGDLDGSIADLLGHGLPRPRLFAFPFSATTFPTNDERIPPLLRRYVSDRFVGVMDNVDKPSFVSRSSNRGYLPRIEIFQDTTLRRFVRAIVEASERGSDDRAAQVQEETPTTS